MHKEYLVLFFHFRNQLFKMNRNDFKKMDQDQRCHYFHFLRRKANQNRFIMVGPYNSTFPGVLDVQFKPLPKKYKLPADKSQDFYQQEEIIVDVDQQQKAQISQAVLDQHEKGIIKTSEPVQKPIMSFEGTISTKRMMQPLIEPKDDSLQIVELYQQSSSPVFITNQADEQKGEPLYSLPLLQVDLKQYTPSFAIWNSMIPDKIHRTQFLGKIRQYRKEIPKDQIMQPRPKSRYYFCTICKKNYLEYLGHVSSKRHQQNYQNNKFTRNLVSLQLNLNTGIFKKQRKKQLARRIKLQQRQEQKERQKEKARDSEVGNNEESIFYDKPEQEQNQSEDSDSLESWQKLVIKREENKRGRPRLRPRTYQRWQWIFPNTNDKRQWFPGDQFKTGISRQLPAKRAKRPPKLNLSDSQSSQSSSKTQKHSQ